MIKSHGTGSRLYTYPIAVSQPCIARMYRKRQFVSIRRQACVLPTYWTRFMPKHVTPRRHVCKCHLMQYSCAGSTLRRHRSFRHTYTTEHPTVVAQQRAAVASDLYAGSCCGHGLFLPLQRAAREREGHDRHVWNLRRERFSFVCTQASSRRIQPNSILQKG